VIGGAVHGQTDVWCFGIVDPVAWTKTNSFRERCESIRPTWMYVRTVEVLDNFVTKFAYAALSPRFFSACRKSLRGWLGRSDEVRRDEMRGACLANRHLSNRWEMR